MPKKNDTTKKINAKGGKIFIISGPSGAGEDSVIKGLKKNIKLNQVVSSVTRKKRRGEKQGKPYNFISVADFKKMIKNNALAEWAIVYGDYRGCPKSKIEKLQKKNFPILWKIDWQGVKTVKKKYPESISIFIAPPSYNSLKKRLLKRGTDNNKTIQKREKFTKEWLKHKNVYDYTVVNEDGKLPKTIDKITKIIQKHSKT
ncbi:guanylate kinase [Patescibacteria group bacterium]|nr:guanylate kinase [Patescibacteria group bacterium]